MTLVQSTMARYQNAKAVKIRVKKKVTLALLDEKKESEGQLFLSKGQMRLEIGKPENSMVIMNSSNIWVITPTPEELGGRPQVLKINSKEMKTQAKAPIAVLLGPSAAWRLFQISEEREEGDVVYVSLKPKTAGSMGELVSVQLEIKKKERLLKRLAYKDELENETTFEFIKTQFSVKVPKSKFHYVPPVNADVTVL